MKTVLSVTTATLCLLLNGCQSQQPPPAYSVTPPPSYQQSDLPGRDGVIHNWATAFNSPALQTFIQQALQHNHDLQATAATLARAAAQTEQAGAARYPSVDISANTSRTENLQPGRSESLTRFPGVSQYGLFLNASWELDMWQRLKAGEKAAAYEYYAVRHDYLAARQALAAQTAQTWFLLIETRQQLQLAQALENNMQRALTVTQAFQAEGLVSLSEVAMARTELAQAREQVLSLRSGFHQAQRNLQVLTGSYPETGLDIPARFPQPAPLPDAGLPAELLERRPDILAAERRIAAAFQQLHQARSARLPRLELSAAFGGNAQSLNTLTDGTNLLWTLAGNIISPLFNAGQLDAAVAQKNAEQNAAIAHYKQTVLTAFNEVETALDKLQLYQQRQQQLQQALDSARQQETMALAQFKAGERELLQLLQANRNTLSARMALLQIQRERLQQQVDLYLALGGSVTADNQTPD